MEHPPQNEIPPITLLNATEIPLTPKLQAIQEKLDNNTPLTLSEKLIGRDTVYTKESIPGITIKPDHAYRAVSKETYEKYIQEGTIEGNVSSPDVYNTEEGNAGVDWYLGGLAPKYGEYILETPASTEFFVLVTHDHSLAGDFSVRHVKSEGGTQKSVPMSNVVVYRLKKDDQQNFTAEKV